MPDAPTDGDEIKALDALLSETRSLIESFRLREAHFAADLAMVGYATSAWDSAKSAEVLLRSTDLSVGAFVCARAAFEAGEDAALLASDPAYDDAGASARVHEVFEYAFERSRWDAVFPGNPTAFPDPDFAQTTQQAESFAADLDAVVPGSGEAIRKAILHWQPRFQNAARKGGATPLHWSGLGRKRIAEEIARRLGQPELASQLSLLYSMLSRYAHPRLRLESWARIEGSEGGAAFRYSDLNRRQAEDAVVVALVLLRDALQMLRAQYDT